MSRFREMLISGERSDCPRRIIAEEQDGTIRQAGWLMPRIDQATVEASPGIQSWSHPRGKVSTELYDENSVARFAAHWERKWRTTYPLDHG